MVFPCQSAKNIDNLRKLNKRTLLEGDRVKYYYLRNNRFFMKYGADFDMLHRPF